MKYCQPLEYRIDRKDDMIFLKNLIQCGNLDMRFSFNCPLKLYFQWDNYFVVLEITDKDTMQLAILNGYIFNYLTNNERIQKFDKVKINITG